MNYPSWIVYLVSPGLFIFLIVLFLITSLILLITLKKLKVGKVKETYKKIILPSCGVTFLSYIIGTLILLLTQFLSRISWIRTNLAEPLIESPFANIYTILYTIFAFLIATYFIFYLNRKITMKAIRLSNKKETKIALILTIFTAPYLFFVPMNVQPKVEPKEIQSEDVTMIESYRNMDLTDKEKLKELMNLLESANSYQDIEVHTDTSPTTITVIYKEGIETPNNQVFEKDSAILLNLFSNIERVEFALGDVYYTFDYEVVNTIHQNNLRNMTIEELLEYYDL